MKTTSLLARFAAGILIAVAFNSANAVATYYDSMESMAEWGGVPGGGPGALNKTLTLDSVNYTEGAGSLKITADYQSEGFAYADIAKSLSTTLDLSSGNFTLSFDAKTSTPKVQLEVTLRTTNNNYYTANYITTSTSWTNPSVSFSLADFSGAAAADLSSVNFIRLRAIADGVSGLPETISVNFDNLQVVPEPSALAMVAGGLGLFGLLRRFRRRFAVLPVLLFAALPALQLKADPVTVAPEKIVSQIQEEKGSAVEGSEWKLTDAKPAELEWRVNTSTAQGFDFARLSFPVSFQITETSIIVLNGSLQLAPDNYFGVELITKDGGLLYTAISTVDASTSVYQIPMNKFSGEDGKTVKYPADIVTVRLMFSGDKSPVAGDNVLKLKSFDIQ